MVLAERLLAEFEAADPDGRLAFLRALADHFGADEAAIEAAIDAWRDAPPSRSRWRACSGPPSRAARSSSAA